MSKCCERDFDNDGNCDRHPATARVQMQQMLPLDNLQAVINHPEVVKAIGVLLAAGLLFTPQRATIFCAYCGEHICFDARVNEEGLTGSEPVEPRQPAFTRNAVDEHRKTCEKYQQATDDPIERGFGDRTFKQRRQDGE